MLIPKFRFQIATHQAKKGRRLARRAFCPPLIPSLAYALQLLWRLSIRPPARWQFQVTAWGLKTGMENHWKTTHLCTEVMDLYWHWRLRSCTKLDFTMFYYSYGKMFPIRFNTRTTSGGWGAQFPKNGQAGHPMYTDPKNKTIIDTPKPNTPKSQLSILFSFFSPPTQHITHINQDLSCFFPWIFHICSLYHRQPNRLSSRIRVKFCRMLPTTLSHNSCETAGRISWHVCMHLICNHLR